MFFVLLAKDLRRTWRNPLPLLINLLMPLCMTAPSVWPFGRGRTAGPWGGYGSLWWMKTRLP